MESDQSEGFACFAFSRPPLCREKACAGWTRRDFAAIFFVAYTRAQKASLIKRLSNSMHSALFSCPDQPTIYQQQNRHEFCHTSSDFVQFTALTCDAGNFLETKKRRLVAQKRTPSATPAHPNKLRLWPLVTDPPLPTFVDYSIALPWWVLGTPLAQPNSHSYLQLSSPKWSALILKSRLLFGRLDAKCAAKVVTRCLRAAESGNCTLLDGLEEPELLHPMIKCCNKLMPT